MYLETAILPAPRKHLNQRWFMYVSSNEVRQQNAMQSSKQTPALFCLRLITSILLTVNIQHADNQMARLTPTSPNTFHFKCDNHHVISLLLANTTRCVQPFHCTMHTYNTEILTTGMHNFPYLILSTSSSSRMRVIDHNWSATKQRIHPQSVAKISRHSVLSGDRIRQCETSSGSRHKDTDQCL